MKSGEYYEFEGYRLDPLKSQLWRDGKIVPLTAKGAEILVALAERAGEVVSKDELMDALWPDAHVEEANLTQNVFLLRKALGETAQDHKFIVTAPRKGYRFAAAVRKITRGNGAAEPSPNLEPAPSSASAGTVPELQQAAGRRVRLWQAASVLVLIVAAYAGWRLLRPPSHAAPRRIVVAVLPFENLTGDAAQEYFIDGLTAEMIIQLGLLDPQHLGVISRTAVTQYQKGQEQLQHLARELAVDYVLEGSKRVRHTGR